MSREDTTNKKGKPHRDRKNPHAAEEFQKQRHEHNVARGKRVFVADEVEPVQDGVTLAHVWGHWERIPA